MSAFNGSYVLDSARSESMDKILTAQGMSWIMRNVVNSLAQTITLIVADGKLTIKQETSLKNTEVVLPLGGELEDFTDDLSGPAKRSARLEGDAIIQVIETKAGITTVTRTLEDGGKILHANIVFKTTSGEELTAQRYFTRK